MVMHNLISDTYINIASVFQKHLSDPTHTHRLIDHGKYRKLASKSKRTEREYPVQKSKYTQQKSVKMSCDSTQFHTFLFCGPH